MRHIALRFTSVIAATAAFSVALAAACSKPQPVMPPPEVTVAPAIERTIADYDEFTGHFEAVQAVDVRPRVSGFIDRVRFPEGSIVKQGDVLITIDPRPYEAEVARAAAALEQAKTHEQLARQELDRARTLVSTQAISREELDARTSTVAESEAQIKGAEAALRNAQLN